MFKLFNKKRLVEGKSYLIQLSNGNKVVAKYYGADYTEDCRGHAHPTGKTSFQDEKGYFFTVSNYKVLKDAR